jgi:hypothetical protein
MLSVTTYNRENIMTRSRSTLGALLIAAATLAGCSATSSSTDVKPAATSSAYSTIADQDYSQAEPPTKPAAATKAAKATGKACETNVMYPCPSLPAEAKPVKPKAAAKPPTVAQEQAIESAQGYIEMSGFSRAGLIEQLSSSAGEGFKKADAVYAVNHINVDWNAEAVESAKGYLEMGGFSRSGLIEQLSSTAGEKFTLKQAKYAVKKVGL